MNQCLACEMICSTFLLQLLNESRENISQLRATLNIVPEDEISRQNIIQELTSREVQDQLVMFLTGPGGCEKSAPVEVA